MRPRARFAVPLLLLLGAAVFAVDVSPAERALGDAHDAWQRGDYIAALTAYLKLLESPEGEAHVAAIARQTGESFLTRELTPDGRNPRFSPDGKYVAYEFGLEVPRRTRIVSSDALATVADVPGISATFSPTTNSVAYLRIVPSDDLIAAATAVDDAPLAAQNRNALIQALAWQVTRHSTITVRDLSTGQETEIAAPGLLKAGLTYAADGRTLYFLGGREGEEDRNDIYGVSPGGQAVRVGDAPGLKGLPVVDPSGAVLLYTVATQPGQNPFRRPQPPGAGGGRGGAGGAAPRGPSFGIIDLATNRTATIDGLAPALSADGQTLAYIARSGDDYNLMIGLPRGPHVSVKKTRERLDAPALSPDGQHIAYQMMTRDDWEIYLSNREGRGESRLTRDVQHDVLPRFIGPDRLLWVVGEPRHRRSFIFDIASGAATRLFHNNTVRTIAPEYQWVLSRDGAQVLVGAERDGNTVSPERGVYVIDLGKTIDRAALVRRVRDNLAAETELRATALQVFAPIAADVKRVVSNASVARVYGYEKALFDFDSKHISRPGNKLAADYLFSTYRSFGYQPEYQWFEQRNALGGRTANVIATLRGTVNPELVYVVSSHYDSVAGGPGADDDSSGTAALLEAARLLAETPMPATVVFASFTGEEAGLLGSREFVRRAVENKVQIAGALNNDMIGFANDQRLDNTIRYSNPGIRDVQHGAAMLFTRLITYDALYFKSTDAAAYYDAYGDIVGGIGSYPVLSNPHYHQAHDFLEFVNHELVTETSKTTAATLMLLASSPSRIKDLTIDSFSGGTATLSWARGPENDITSYIVSYGVPGAPARRATVRSPRAKLTSVAPGSVVAVKAVNARGLEGWDWARVTIR
jgi:hypothetical protein